MSIVKMKRIRLIGLLSDRDTLLQQLLLRGCVEISEFPQEEGDARWGELVAQNTSELAVYRAQHTRLTAALAILDKYAREKTGLFSNRAEISVEALFSPELIQPALQTAEALSDLESRISRLYAVGSHLETEITALSQWSELDVPLDFTGTRSAAVLFGTAPASVSLEALRGGLAAAAAQSELFPAGGGKAQQCLMLVCHRAVLESAANVLRSYGFSPVGFGDTSGTALENVQRLNEELINTRSEIERLKAIAAGQAGQRAAMKLCADRLTQEIAKEEAKERLAVSGSVFAMEGWLSAPEEAELNRLLGTFTCAYTLSDPAPGDQVPVKLKSNRLTEPLNMVTEMYSLPTYDGIDPNGLIMPFFTLFFGIMYADLGYGLILMLIGLIVKRKCRLRGTIKYMMGLMVMCGITTAVCGVLFGGFFGDAIPVISETFGGKRVQLWSLIDPMQEPMTIMIGAFILGAIQIVTGMAVKAYLCVRDGHALDAFLDIGSWWLLFAGIGVFAMGHGYWVAIAGVAALVLTQGRDRKGILGKLIGGISSLYGIVDYVSDILSYIRLMALLLATSVIASVVNILGSMTGSIIAFFIIFLIGHAFNMGINIVGTYVHTARLQYLEFFGKFYKDGGKAFRPLKIDTKYHDVI